MSLAKQALRHIDAVIEEGVIVRVKNLVTQVKYDNESSLRKLANEDGIVCTSNWNATKAEKDSFIHWLRRRGYIRIAKNTYKLKD